MDHRERTSLYNLRKRLENVNVSIKETAAQLQQHETERKTILHSLSCYELRPEVSSLLDEYAQVLADEIETVDDDAPVVYNVMLMRDSSCVVHNFGITLRHFPENDPPQVLVGMLKEYALTIELEIQEYGLCTSDPFIFYNNMK